MPHDISPADDQRVLDELERLRRAIRAGRGRPAPQAGGAPVEVPLTARDATSEARRPATPPPPPPEPSLRPAPLPIVEPRAAPLVSAVAAAPSSARAEAGAAPEPARSAPRARILLASLAVAIGLLLGWFLLRDPAPAPPVETAAAPQEVVAAPPPEPPPPAVDPHPLRIDIVTSRPVWMRVTVDGRIAIERELPQGERLPFGADKSIVVRAGDAGAVSVWIGNVDQGPLGRDGQVATRLFEAPAR